MGISNCIRFAFMSIVQITLLLLVIIYLPYLPPNAVISTPYKVESAGILEGKLSLNQKLNGVTIWHENELDGPEAFADYNGELYTTLNTGYIVKLTGNHITPIVTFGKPCRGEHEAAICGRPLGLTFDKAGTLYVADAYYGIFKVNVKTGTSEKLVSADKEIGGKKPTLFNSLVVSSNNDVYFTESSTEFQLHDGMFDMLADGSGRLLKYDSKTKNVEVLMDNIHFANGIAFGTNEEYLIVSESARNRIHRYYLKGSKKNTHDIFLDKLPGIPDNLKADSFGGFLVPLVVAADADHPSVNQVLGQFPKIRKLIARLLGLSELLFVKINELYENDFCKKTAHTIGHFTSINFLLPPRLTILHVSGTGEILDSLHADNKKIAGISEAHIFNGVLYLGSPFNAFIGTVPLKDIGWSHLQTKPKLTTK